MGAPVPGCVGAPVPGYAGAPVPGCAGAPVPECAYALASGYAGVLKPVVGAQIALLGVLRVGLRACAFVLDAQTALVCVAAVAAPALAQHHDHSY